ncbi:MAG: T9SS type A sorting domain-containing protein, partial [Ignavibacteriaceae bacterium]|nr:T9SS type A sorting domain-containing protein [Ignavibacteriaceae bacterium]
MLVGFRESNGTTTETQYYSYEDDITGINATALEYRLKQIDYNGKYSFSEIAAVDNLAPNGFVLEQNYPNPFNPNTVISYQLPVSGFVSLKVYDVLGNEVATLVNEEKQAGSYEIVFNANHLSAGVYYYTIVTDNFVQTKKMILMK